MKKYMTGLLLFLTIPIFSVPEDTARQILEREQQRLDQERMREEQKRKLEELENSNLGKEIRTENEKTGYEIGPRFLIREINIRDIENLLTQNEELSFFNRYRYTEMGSTEIRNLLTEITNRLISKGYITSYAGILSDNDLSTGVLDIEIVPGLIEDIIINEGNSLDKLKEFFMFKRNKGDVLNIRDIDEATENFNSLRSNNMEFVGIKSPINSTLNQKYKSYNGYELVLSKDLRTVISDQNNRGTFNWDSGNNLEHLNTDVRLYNEYGSGKEDKSSKVERIKVDKFIKSVWFNLKTGYKFEKYIKDNKIQIITPKVMKDYSEQMKRENIEHSRNMMDNRGQ